MGLPGQRCSSRQSPLKALIKWWALAGGAGGPLRRSLARIISFTAPGLPQITHLLRITPAMRRNGLQPAGFNPSRIPHSPRRPQGIGELQGTLRFGGHPLGCRELVGARGFPETLNPTGTRTYGSIKQRLAGPAGRLATRCCVEVATVPRARIGAGAGAGADIRGGAGARLVPGLQLVLEPPVAPEPAPEPAPTAPCVQCPHPTGNSPRAPPGREQPGRAGACGQPTMCRKGVNPSLSPVLTPPPSRRHRGGVSAALLRRRAQRPQLRGHEEGGVRGPADPRDPQPPLLRLGESRGDRPPPSPSRTFASR